MAKNAPKIASHVQSDSDIRRTITSSWPSLGKTLSIQQSLENQSKILPGLFRRSPIASLLAQADWRPLADRIFTGTRHTGQQGAWRPHQRNHSTRRATRSRADSCLLPMQASSPYKHLEPLGFPGSLAPPRLLGFGGGGGAGVACSIVGCGCT